MKQLTLPLCVLILLGCFSCGSSSEEVHRITNFPSPSLVPANDTKVENWQLNTKTENKSFLSDNIDSMIIIKPETNDNNLIGAISGIFLKGDSLIIIDASKSQNIYIFNKKGKYISSIGSRGEGPDEYGSINGVALYDNQLYVLDWIKNRLLGFPLGNGETTKRDFKNMRPDNFAVLDDSIIIASYASYFENNPFALTWIDNSGKILQTSRPFTYSLPFPAGTFKRTIDDRLLYFRNDCDTIFEICKDYIAPKYTLGLGNDFYDFVEDNKNLSREQFFKKLYTEDTSPLNMYNLYDCNQTWIIHFQKGSKAYISTVDKKTGKTSNYLRSDIQKQEVYVPFIFFPGDDKHLVTYIDNTFMDMVSATDKQRLFKTFPFLENIVLNYDFDNLNPLICIMKLKNQY